MKSFRYVLATVVTAVVGLSAFDTSAALSAKSYVLDGLLIHWDGIENVAYGSAHDGTAATWTDLTGSGLALTKPEAFLWAENGLVSVRAVQAATQVGHAQVLRVYNAINTQSYSCEVAYNKPKDTPNSTIGDYKTPIVALFGFFYSSRYWFGLDGETKAGGNVNGVTGSEKALVSATSVTVTDTKGKHVLSCIQDITNVVIRFDAIAEKTAVVTKATSDILTKSTKSVMLNQTYADRDVGLEGTYHAIRFYDRPLSADEVKVNTALDQVRFFGADAATITLPDGWRFSDASGELNLERRYAATVSAPGCGTVSINDGETGESVGLWLVHNEATTVKLAAVPADGWVFVCWRGLASEEDANKAEVTASVMGNVTAVFRRLDKLSARCYVDEGLIGQWDGVENVAYGQSHDNTAEKWYELTGNSPNFKLPEGASFDSDNLAVIRANGSLSDANGAKIITAFNAQSYTCEIAYKKSIQTPDSTAGHGKPNAQMLGFNNNSAYWFGNDADTYVGFCPNDGTGRGPGLSKTGRLSVPTTMGQHSFSCVQDGTNIAIRADATLSGEAILATTAKVELNTLSLLSLNWVYYDDSGLDGCYYAIRFYDRPLTADEVSVNVAVDQVRFFGKDPEACALPTGYRFNAMKGYPLERKYSVASNDGTQGLVSVDGGEAAAAVDAWVDQATRRVVLAAVPADGYKFARWTGAISGGDLKSATGTFTVTGDVTAEFKEITGLILMVR